MINRGQHDHEPGALRVVACHTVIDQRHRARLGWPPSLPEQLPKAFACPAHPGGPVATGCIAYADSIMLFMIPGASRMAATASGQSPKAFACPAHPGGPVGPGAQHILIIVFVKLLNCGQQDNEPDAFRIISRNTIFNPH
jgi:hypothetical protein